MVTLNMLKNLTDGDGLTLKNWNPIRYHSGWQVATEGLETSDPAAALDMVAAYSGTCGIWYEGGTYYIDRSHRENTKTRALQVGREHNQISIYGWKTGRLAYC